MSPTIIYASKRKMILLAVGALIFIVIGCSFITMDFTGDQHRLLYMIIGFISIIFFGACFIFIVKQIFSKKPALIIDEAGITDNSSAIKSGLVTWQEIEDIQFITYLGQHFLAIYTVDKNLIVNRTNNFQRWIHQLNKKLLDSQINIPYKNLKCTDEELGKAINYFWQKEYETDGIE